MYTILRGALEGCQEAQFFPHNLFVMLRQAFDTAMWSQHIFRVRGITRVHCNDDMVVLQSYLYSHEVDVCLSLCKTTFEPASMLTALSAPSSGPRVAQGAAEQSQRVLLCQCG
jgi:hypothetical protein